ncbi:hypothetical protein BKA70DRAFT_1452637 [Coprinopsis sp. MPI-PUGE-AT-0042]|nr:hypothetical protein BKA70DRAFT_1452637 [Coprinopsis sp. MPI-PUGE-AT-0042]
MPSLSSKSSDDSEITERLHSTVLTKLSCNIRKVIPATLAPATNSRMWPSLRPPGASSMRSIPTAPSCRPSRPDTAGSTNVTHSPDLVHLKLGEIQNYARALQFRNGPLRLMLVARIIAMVKVPTPTIGGRETRRAALLGGSDAVGVVLATCDQAGKSELVCSALDGLKQPKAIPASDSGVAENPTDPSMTPYSLLDLGSGLSLDHLRNGAGAIPAKPMSTSQSTAAEERVALHALPACEVNRKGVIAAKEPTDVTNAPGNPDGRPHIPAFEEV